MNSTGVAGCLLIVLLVGLAVVVLIAAALLSGVVK